MSVTFSKVEVITDVARRRRFTTEQKLLVVNETLQPGIGGSWMFVAERLQFGAVSVNSGANLCRRKPGHWRLAIVNYIWIQAN